MRITRIITLCLLSLAAGCTTVYYPDGQKIVYCRSTEWGIVNNTVYELDIFQDGVKIARIVPGQVLAIGRPMWKDSSLVSVSAYSGDYYVGANSYTFSIYTAYNWQIDSVQKVSQ